MWLHQSSQRRSGCVHFLPEGEGNVNCSSSALDAICLPSIPVPARCLLIGQCAKVEISISQGNEKLLGRWELLPPLRPGWGGVMGGERESVTVGIGE